MAADGPPVARASDQLRLADLLAALSLAADLAVELPPEHVLRSCYIGMRIGTELNLPDEEKVNLYYALLLMDAGCTAWTSQFATLLLGNEMVARTEFVFQVDRSNPLSVLSWMREHVAPEEPAPRRARQAFEFMLRGPAFAREGFRNTCEVAQRFAARLGLSDDVQQALLSVFEQWDGSGPHGLQGAAIPTICRIIYLSAFLEVFHRLGDRPAAITLARQRYGHAFDPAIVDAFLRLAASEEFWTCLEDEESIWTTVQDMEPTSAWRYLPADRLEDVALAFADFTDLKWPDGLGHSRRVADMAEHLAQTRGLPRDEVRMIRLAALLHDLGLVAVSSHTLAKPRHRLSETEWERMRLHPYHAERIIGRVPALAGVLPAIRSHHERFDGNGYPAGLTGPRIPLSARIIAVADRFDELRHDAPGASDMEVPVRTLLGESGGALDPELVAAFVRDVVGSDVAPGPRAALARVWPAGLSDREVEILRLLARGLSRRDIAAHLVLSEHTVRHHLEHVYTKIGVETRVAAVLYAVEHELIN
jgi:HD-GYP domain-containing protein (c-di-GMP phosphodiesterase class II)/DNA-binding CsgD family transcriptional regulator